VKAPFLTSFRNIFLDLTLPTNPSHSPSLRGKGRVGIETIPMFPLPVSGRGLGGQVSKIDTPKSFLTLGQFGRLSAPLSHSVGEGLGVRVTRTLLFGPDPIG